MRHSKVDKLFAQNIPAQFNEGALRPSLGLNAIHGVNHSAGHELGAAHADPFCHVVNTFNFSIGHPKSDERGF